jgi:hypothetical protein
MNFRTRATKVVFVLGSMILMGGPRRLPAQTQFDSRMDGFRNRAAQLRREIAAVSISSRYCDAAARNADGRRLLDLQAQLERLTADYKAYADSVRGSASRLQSIAQFNGADPRMPSFWTSYDQDVIVHTKADLDQQLKLWRASALLCDNKTSAPPVDSGQPAPPRPRPDPLTGLKRPNLPNPPVPEPKVFCSDLEKIQWIQQVISPLLNSITQALNPARDYMDAVRDRLAAAQRATPPDTLAVDALTKEAAWAKKAHQDLDDLYDKIRAVVDSSKVIDCTRKVAVPLPSGNPDSTSRARKDTVPPQVGRAIPRDSTRTGIYVSIDGGGVYFPQFPATVRDAPGLTGSTAQQAVGRVGVSAEWRMNRKLGIRASYSRDRRSYSQTFQNGGVSQRFDGIIKDQLWLIDLGYRGSFKSRRLIDLSPWQWEFWTGMARALDEIIGTSANGATGTRNVTGYKTSVGAAIDRRLNNRLSLGIEDRCTLGGRFKEADLSNQLMLYLTARAWRP